MSQKIHSDTNPTNTIKFITSILFSCILYPTKTSNCFSIVFYISRYDPLSTYLSLKCMLALTVPSFIRALQSSLKSELHMSSLLSLSQLTLSASGPTACLLTDSHPFCPVTFWFTLHNLSQWSFLNANCHLTLCIADQIF